MLNSALIAARVVGILDNVIAHWWLQLHRILPGPEALPVEIAVVILGIGALVIGIWRERRARKIDSAPHAQTEL